MNPRQTLLASCFAAALSSAGAVFVLMPDPHIAPAEVSEVDSETAEAFEHTGIAPAGPDMPSVYDEASVVKVAARIDLKPSSVETGALPAVEELPPRLAFVAPSALPLRLTSLVDEHPSENPETWRTEAQIDAAVPAPSQQSNRVALGKTEALPWQQPNPLHANRPRDLRDKLAQISPGATQRLREKFETAKAVWPAVAIALVAIKDKREVELHARAKGGGWTFIHRYPVRAASGKAGPKLAQGDKQVPEGVYGISFLNPNSKYHVALRVNYPNAFDRDVAKLDGRKKLGGDIMIHGKASSAGCLAMGDEAAEELFVLAAEVGTPNIKVVIAPTDFRKGDVTKPKPGEPAWLPKLYAEVASAMTEFPAPANTSPSLLSLFDKLPSL